MSLGLQQAIQIMKGSILLRMPGNPWYVSGSPGNNCHLLDVLIDSLAGTIKKGEKAVRQATDVELKTEIVKTEYVWAWRCEDPGNLSLVFGFNIEMKGPTREDLWIRPSSSFTSLASMSAPGLEFLHTKFGPDRYYLLPEAGFNPEDIKLPVRQLFKLAARYVALF